MWFCLALTLYRRGTMGRRSRSCGAVLVARPKVTSHAAQGKQELRRLNAILLGYVREREYSIQARSK